MSEHNHLEKNGQDETKNARRDFLKQGATATGALIGLSILGTSAGASRADDDHEGREKAPDKNDAVSPKRGAPATKSATSGSTLQLSLKDHKALAQIGGFEIVAVPAVNDTLIVARTDATTVVACSAICTHRGCKVGYEHEAKAFVCPCHGARFALGGSVLRGPAKKPLKNYATDVAAVVSLGVAKTSPSG